MTVKQTVAIVGISLAVAGWIIYYVISRVT